MTVDNPVFFFAVIVLLLASLVAMATRRLRLPYTVGLVIIGLILGIINRTNILALSEFTFDLVKIVETEITPGIILGIFVTPIIFEAAIHLRWADLQRDLRFILILAIPGVLISTFLVGVFLFAGANLTGSSFPFTYALLFGAMIAATDPVSVVALFRSIGAPKRLQVLMEGESLFNDGTAIVVFSLMLDIALRSTSGDVNPEYLGYIADFIKVVGGGVIIGLSLGWLVSKIISQIDDHLIETTITTVLAFGTYLTAEYLDVSGVLAVVAAGLVSGNIGPRGMSPTTHILVTNFWEYAAFLSNSFIFIVIGLEVDFTELIQQWQPLLIAILAALGARASVIYFFTRFQKDIPWRWSHILFWGGLRGAVSLVLALSLPIAIANDPNFPLRNMTFGVVLFTILVQGFSMEPVVKRLKITQRTEMQEEYERRHARAVAARAAYEHLELRHTQGLISKPTWEKISPLLEGQIDSLIDAVKEVLEDYPEVVDEELDTARREVLKAQRSALISLVTDGVIDEEVYSQLVRGVDMQLEGDQMHWIHLLKGSTVEPETITRMMATVIQFQDVENAYTALSDAGYIVTRFSSSGGFLGKKNVTLLIGLPEDQVERVMAILEQSCRQRVEYVSPPIEGAPFSVPLLTPIKVGGATIFLLRLERYEEIL